MRLKFIIICALLLAGCRERTKVDIGYDSTLDTTNRLAPPSLDSARPKIDTATSKSDSLILPDPIPPERLANFLPKMEGFIAGELQKEIDVRKNYKASKVKQQFWKGDKKFTVEIDDFCNVPYLYDSYKPFLEGEYLHEDNVEKTET